MQWDILNQRTVMKTVPFTVEELHLKDRIKGPLQHPYHRLSCPDWVNVFAVTPDQKAILIRQSRAGSWNEELETPGGSLDTSEKDPTLAAVRELEEETGYTSQRILPLGSLNPNPALFNNKLHMFLALHCTIPAERKHFPDEGEKISIELVPITEVYDLVRFGQINSCLCALTIMLASRYLNS